MCPACSWCNVAGHRCKLHVAQAYAQAGGNRYPEGRGGVVSVILKRPASAKVIAGLRLLAGDGVRVPNYPCVVVAGLCDETDPEYELRFDADEEYVRELIDRIDGCRFAE